jgi:PAS domain-containing protein
MEYQGLTTDDLADVRELNRAWLKLTGRTELLATAPFLLFSFREHDDELWSRLLADGAQRDLFTGRLPGSDEHYALQAAGLAFLWELSRRNPYVARIVGGAPLDWCRSIAAATIVRVIDCAGRRDLVEPRFSREAAVYKRASAHLPALQSMLTTGIEPGAARLPAAACRMRGPARRITDKL